jgi:hypothetical protein
MTDDQAIHIAGVVVLAFVFRFLHEAIKNFFRARKARKAQANRQH